ncbi:hypothetical protein [Paracoccus siganidrum]|uniref:Type II toxin-antitoxin system ParD family antitoxin n=1 Tax=Paracoccus siganidrum TaxID=1276757 RepID=A0A418ZTE2_9RHOB|nr:hypothetical protein [Paracoccus siganidrum]RJL01219.1 hypothetical protein D3P05_22400 [Paracoccus siganidrum]RMC26977.1 hypothetical protein C9E82_22245 [Paracoccus siganidrum]
MTVKATLRHHRFLTKRVSAGVFAPQSAMVAAALGQMIEDEQEREVARGILADEIRGRLQTSREDFNDAADAFARARRRGSKSGRR